jgi:TIR domain
VKVFISWSGVRSRETAKLLRKWLKQIINEVEPWMSEEDLTKGGDWSGDITSQLNDAAFGIICVTPGNKDRPWLLFEAGALSRQVNNVATRVAPLLIGFNSKSDVPYPLGRFQATEPTKVDMFKFIKSVNDACTIPRQLAELEEAFEVWWPHFETPFRAIEQTRPQAASRRSDRDVLDEVLNIVRTIQKQSAPPPRVSVSLTRKALEDLDSLVSTGSPSMTENIRARLRSDDALREFTVIASKRGLLVQPVLRHLDETKNTVFISGASPGVASSLSDEIKHLNQDLDVRFISEGDS